QAVQELVGSTRCAILLIESSVSGNEPRGSHFQARNEDDKEQNGSLRVNIAAQKGLHLSSQSWQPQLGEHLLLGQVMRTRRSLVIPNTNLRPEIEFPLLDDNGIPRRPGSVLCVPIFELDPPAHTSNNSYSRVEHNSGSKLATKAILGTIEVYHRRARGLPIEEVELLEQFAQQAGLAIQNARLFLSIDHLEQVAREQAHQRENVMQAIPDGVIIYDAHWHIADTNNAIRNLLGWS